MPGRFAKPFSSLGPLPVKHVYICSIKKQTIWLHVHLEKDTQFIITQSSYFCQTNIDQNPNSTDSTGFNTFSDLCCQKKCKQPCFSMKHAGGTVARYLGHHWEILNSDFSCKISGRMDGPNMGECIILIWQVTWSSFNCIQVHSKEIFILSSFLYIKPQNMET